MKIRSKIMIGLYEFLLPALLLVQPTFAYDPTSGNTEYLLNDEWSVVSNDIPNSTATGSRNSLTNNEFTIVFLETATTLTGQLEVYFGTDFSEEHPNSEHFVIGQAGAPLDLRNYMLYCPNFGTLEDNLVAFKLSTGGVSLVPYLNTYARIIYDSPNDILNNMVDYYYADGESDGYVSGAEAGYQTGYQDGQDEMFAQGSANFGYNVVDAYDYELGYDNGYDDAIDEPIEASGIQFMEDFKNWILPALLIVILLGGAMSVIAKKKRDEE